MLHGSSEKCEAVDSRNFRRGSIWEPYLKFDDGRAFFISRRLLSVVVVSWIKLVTFRLSSLVERTDLHPRSSRQKSSFFSSSSSSMLTPINSRLDPLYTFITQSRLTIKRLRQNCTQNSRDPHHGNSTASNRGDESM